MTTKDRDDETSIDCDELQELDVETICILCNAEFLDPEDLKVHVDQVHAVAAANSRQCHFCGSSYADLEAYAVHLRDNHLNFFQVCQYCMKVFTNADELRHHERSHSSNKINHKRCSQCEQLFDNISELEQHEYEEHNNDLNGVLLVDYYPILSSVWNMKAVAFLQSPLDTIYNCSACGYTNNDLSAYIAHLQKRNCRSKVCNTCSNVYRNTRCLRKHISDYKDCSESYAWKQCRECNKYVKTLFYQNHVKLCSPLKCGVCNIIFNSMNELSEHHSRNHPLSVEVKLCKFCSRQCVGNASLLKHIARVHRCEFHLYKYKCIECDMAFKHPQKLFAHYYIKHKDIEPYTCRICNKKYRVRKRFTIHIKLDHKSVGFVEFDENYHVFFTDKRSANPFIPTCVIREEDYSDPIKVPTVTENQPISVKKLATLQNLNLDDLNQTETEANMTEVETKSKKMGAKRKMKFKISKITKKVNKVESKVMSLDSSDDDDMPLLTLRKRKQPVSHNKRRLLTLKKFKKSLKPSKNNRKQLTCDQCQKYCYTYQNYQHHMSLHTKKGNKTCIKCAKDFKTEEKLNKHIKTEHSSSKLTETLKSLLEKRKNGIRVSDQNTTPSEKFKSTIKKAKSDIVSEVATLTVVENGLSVQKFIENFSPEMIEAKKKNATNLYIENTITIKLVNCPFYRKPIIRFKKINTQPLTSNGKLSLPVKFKPDNSENVKVNINLVQNSVKSNFQLSLHDVPDNADANDEVAYSDNYEETEEYRGDVIPDVGHEVMLEETEEAPTSSPVLHKIVLPKVPNNTNVSIAHLMPEAPFYKIVKVKDVINNTMAKQEKKEKPPEIRKDTINLPDGTKLVTVNPLAHLMGERDLDSIMQPIQNKYYKPKHNNLETLLTKALQKASRVDKRTLKKKKHNLTQYRERT